MELKCSASQNITKFNMIRGSKTFYFCDD